MITKQEKIDAIYEKIARKDIDLWCKIKLKTGVINTAVWKPAWPLINCLFFRQIKTEDIGEIIGHPVMIGDVMDYFENIALDKIYDYIWVKKEEIPDLILQKTKDAMMEIFPFWKQKRLPIEDQSDECIDFVYSLISK